MASTLSSSNLAGMASPCRQASAPKIGFFPSPERMPLSPMKPNITAPELTIFEVPHLPGCIDDKENVQSSRWSNSNTKIFEDEISDKPYQDSGVLWKARQILSRLENEEGEWVDAFGEAQSSLKGLEDDLQYFESASSRPGTADRTPMEAAVEPEDVPATVSAFAARLDELRSQVASVLEQKGPDEDFVARLRQQLEEGDEEVALPSLGGAVREAGLPEPSEDEDLDVDGAAADTALTALGFDMAGDCFEGWQARDGPNLELLKALDIQLPASDGVWDDDEVERMCGAINTHYGDVPAEVLVEDGPGSEEEVA